MADLPHNDLLQILVARGLIAAAPAPVRLASGNLDRRQEPARSSWRVSLQDGRAAKLTLGSKLASLAARCAAFAQACPAIAAAPIFHEQLPAGVEAFAELFFDGMTLDAAVRDRLLPSNTVQAAFERVCATVKATEHPSTAQARAAEWREWQERLCALPFWSENDRRLLREDVLPHLYDSLAVSPPVTRWTNGDFLGGNLLVAADGRGCLVDTEFATRTHFFAEDAVRFQVLSEGARLQPALFEAVLPDPGPAWHLFFWFRQLQLESVNNTAEYLARIRPIRLAVIRRLAEHLLNQPLPAWPVAATPVAYHLEQARWVAAMDRPLEFAGWCFVPSAQPLRSVVVLAGARLAETAPIPRPDVQRHFDGAALALHTGFALRVPPVENNTRLTLAAITNDGTLLPFHAVRAGDLPGRGPVIVDYPEWAAQCDPDPGRTEIGGGRQEAGSAGEAQANGCTAIKFSVLLPVYNTPEAFLRACLESVRRQHYQNWELCVVDDASHLPHIRPMVEAAARDHRVRLRRREINGGIAEASNDALAMASGEYVVLLDHDDLLRPHALAELARMSTEHPDADAVYSDEDKITADGRRVLPVFKSDFSSEFVRGVMYIGHVLCVRTAIARAAGGFDAAYDGVQDYEFFLRVSQLARRIVHLPKVLYHWRESPASSALHGNVKGDMDEKQLRAVRAHLTRLGMKRRTRAMGGHRVLVSADPTQRHAISLVLAWAAGGPSHSLEQCLQDDSRLRPVEVLTTPTVAPQNHGGVATRGIRSLPEAIHARGDLVVIVTTPPVSLTPDFWNELADLAAQPGCGAVAPTLLSADGHVLESGWVAGLDSLTPVMRGFDPFGDGYNGSLRCSREVSAHSGLCLALRREHLALLAGDAWDLPAPLWAIHLCLQLGERGLFNRVAASAQMGTVHPWTWQDDIQVARRAVSQESWRARLARPDPFFNPHFDYASADYRLKPQIALDQATPIAATKSSLDPG